MRVYVATSWSNPRVISIRVKDLPTPATGSEVRACIFCEYPAWVGQGIKEDLRGESFDLVCLPCATDRGFEFPTEDPGEAVLSELEANGIPRARVAELLREYKERKKGDLP